MLFDEVLEWCTETRDLFLKEGHRKPILIGISAPQGAGKSTLASSLVSSLALQDKRAVSLSIDDFYLTHAEQSALARRHPDNPYLQKRGYAGTHDLKLGSVILERLQALQSGEILSCPVYDKSSHGGQGDRFPESLWKTVEGPLDFIFFDGWMLGFFPAKSRDGFSDPFFEETDRLLEPYAEWTRKLDAFIHLLPEDRRYVLDWRSEAEAKMRASGKEGMSEEEIRRYLALFLPAYDRYLPALWSTPPLPKEKCFRAVIGKDRGLLRRED